VYGERRHTAETASSRGEEVPPPKLMETTEGLPEASAASPTNSRPETMSAVEPEPSSLRTLTAKRFAFLATPYAAEPTVPAQWVPCPLPSAS